MVVALIVGALAVVAGVVVYKLVKAGKAVTGASVVAGVEADVTQAAKNVANTVSSKV